MRRFCAGFDGFQLVSKYAHAHVQYYAIYNIFSHSPLPLYSHHQCCPLCALSRICVLVTVLYLPSGGVQLHGAATMNEWNKCEWISEMMVSELEI